MKIINLKKDDHGSTLLLVVVALAFIGVLSSIVISITTINFQMKTIDDQSRENFYEAEVVVQDVKSSLEQISAEVLEDAYKKILTNYTAYTEAGTNITDKFDELYLTELSDKLSVGVANTYYNSDNIRVNMNPALQACLITTSGALQCNSDSSLPISQRCVVLKDIKIYCKNTNNQQVTTITTDIVMNSPGMTFTAGGYYPEFSKFAVIADNQLGTLAGSSSIEGNVYTGQGGVLSSVGQLKVLGNLLITRGDIVVTNDSELIIGSLAKKTQVYAENIGTKPGYNSNEAKLTMNANSYVSNDLAMNAKNSVVKISGNYSGFSFNYSNDLSDTDNAAYSSAILVNGKHSSLDLSGVDNLLLAGHAFISTSGTLSTTGITMGQSIGVKSNQKMYLIDEKYLKTDAHNPMTQSDYEEKFPSGNPENILKVADIPAEIWNTLDNAGRVATYYYRLPGGEVIVYFYWKFKDQKSANEFFKYCVDNTELSKFNEQMEDYIDPTKSRIILNESGLYAENAGRIFCYKDDAVDPGYKLIADNGSNPFSDPDNPTASMLTRLKDISKIYLARQMNLTTTIGGTDTRLLNKADNPLFESIISQESGDSVISMEATGGESYGFNGGIKKVLVDLDSDGLYDAYVIIVDNESSSTFKISQIASISPTTSLKYDATKASYRGIIIATGNVEVDQNFDGLIIAGKDVMVNAVTVRSDVTLIRKIFKYGIDHYSSTDAKHQFLHYFAQYQSGVTDAGGTGTVDLASSIVYENWKKNAD